MAWDKIIHYYSCSKQLKVKVFGHKESIATSKNYIQKVGKALLFVCFVF